MPERLKAILDKITAWWKKFNTKQRSVLISIVAVVIVALVILGVVISRPTQVELVEAQSASEASTIKGVLEDNNISYEVDSKLVFFVNKSDEVNAIMALGDNGIPAQAYSIDNVTDGSFSTTEAGIRGAILDQIRKMDWIPRTVRQRQRKIDEAIKNIELRTGKTANDADLAKELSISEDELCSWQSQLKVTNVVSLDEFDESGPEPVMDAAHNSHYAQPEEIVTQEELKTMLVKSLDNLTEKERRVIELYYYEDLTLKEISNILEVSESRVSQLHTKGLIKMRKVMGPYMNILTNA